MSPSVSRREFVAGVGHSIVSGGLATVAGRAETATAADGALQSTRSLQLTKRPVALQTPLQVPRGEVWHYGLTYPFQVAERKAAVFCNIRSRHGHDSEAGTDVVLFGDLTARKGHHAVPISRNHTEQNPHAAANGGAAVMVKYPVAGGFVPLGARRADRKHHPHAGSGFGIATAIAWRPDLSGTFEGAESYEYLELYQFEYDGEQFRVVNSDRLAYNELLAGLGYIGRPICNAIPDGDDLLLALSAAEPGKSHCCGVTRWRKTSAGWKPVDWIQVTDNDGSFEPTLIRDLDNGLLFCARGSRDFRYDIRVWRGGGQADWQKTIHMHGAIPQAPISINLAADGPYIAANLYEVFRDPVPASARLPRDAAGRSRLGGWSRDKLVFWPLTEQRDDLKPGIVVRNGSSEFGPAPGGMGWAIDHPSTAVCQLEDGRWHNLMGMRIVDFAEVLHGADPTPQTGGYLEEVLSDGEPEPAWIFG